MGGQDAGAAAAVRAGTPQAGRSGGDGPVGARDPGVRLGDGRLEQVREVIDQLHSAERRQQELITQISSGRDDSEVVAQYARVSDRVLDLTTARDMLVGELDEADRPGPEVRARLESALDAAVRHRDDHAQHYEALVEQHNREAVVSRGLEGEIRAAQGMRYAWSARVEDLEQAVQAVGRGEPVTAVERQPLLSGAVEPVADLRLAKGKFPEGAAPVPSNVGPVSAPDPRPEAQQHLAPAPGQDKPPGVATGSGEETRAGEEARGGEDARAGEEARGGEVPAGAGDTGSAPGALEEHGNSAPAPTPPPKPGPMTAAPSARGPEQLLAVPYLQRSLGQAAATRVEGGGDVRHQIESILARRGLRAEDAELRRITDHIDHDFAGFHGEGRLFTLTVSPLSGSRQGESGHLDVRIAVAGITPVRRLDDQEFTPRQELYLRTGDSTTKTRTSVLGLRIPVSVLALAPGVGVGGALEVGVGATFRKWLGRTDTTADQRSLRSTGGAEFRVDFDYDITVSDALPVRVAGTGAVTDRVRVRGNADLLVPQALLDYTATPGRRFAVSQEQRDGITTTPSLAVEAVLDTHGLRERRRQALPESVSRPGKPGRETLERISTATAMQSELIGMLQGRRHLPEIRGRQRTSAVLRSSAHVLALTPLGTTGATGMRSARATGTTLTQGQGRSVEASVAAGPAVGQQAGPFDWIAVRFMLGLNWARSATRQNQTVLQNKEGHQINHERVLYEADILLEEDVYQPRRSAWEGKVRGQRITAVLSLSQSEARSLSLQGSGSHRHVSTEQDPARVPALPPWLQDGEVAGALATTILPVTVTHDVGAAVRRQVRAAGFGDLLPSDILTDSGDFRGRRRYEADRRLDLLTSLESLTSMRPGSTTLERVTPTYRDVLTVTVTPRVADGPARYLETWRKAPVRSVNIVGSQHVSGVGRSTEVHAQVDGQTRIGGTQVGPIASLRWSPFVTSRTRGSGNQQRTHSLMIGSTDTDVFRREVTFDVAVTVHRRSRGLVSRRLVGPSPADLPATESVTSVGARLTVPRALTSPAGGASPWPAPGSPQPVVGETGTEQAAPGHLVDRRTVVSIAHASTVQAMVESAVEEAAGRRSLQHNRPFLTAAFGPAAVDQLFSAQGWRRRIDDLEIEVRPIVRNPRPVTVLAPGLQTEVAQLHGQSVRSGSARGRRWAAAAGVAGRTGGTGDVAVLTGALRWTRDQLRVLGSTFTGTLELNAVQGPKAVLAGVSQDLEWQVSVRKVGWRGPTGPAVVRRSTISNGLAQIVTEGQLDTLLTTAGAPRLASARETLPVNAFGLQPPHYLSGGQRSSLGPGLPVEGPDLSPLLPRLIEAMGRRAPSLFPEGSDSAGNRSRVEALLNPRGVLETMQGMMDGGAVLKLKTYGSQPSRGRRNRRQQLAPVLQERAGASTPQVDRIKAKAARSNWLSHTATLTVELEVDRARVERIIADGGDLELYSDGTVDVVQGHVRGWQADATAGVGYSGLGEPGDAHRAFGTAQFGSNAAYGRQKSAAGSETAKVTALSWILAYRAGIVLPIRAVRATVEMPDGERFQARATQQDDPDGILARPVRAEMAASALHASARPAAATGPARLTTVAEETDAGQAADYGERFRAGQEGEREAWPAESNVEFLVGTSDIRDLVLSAPGRATFTAAERADLQVGLSNESLRQLLTLAARPGGHPLRDDLTLYARLRGSRDPMVGDEVVVSIEDPLGLHVPAMPRALNEPGTHTTSTVSPPLPAGSGGVVDGVPGREGAGSGGSGAAGPGTRTTYGHTGALARMVRRGGPSVAVRYDLELVAVHRSGDVATVRRLDLPGHIGLRMNLEVARRAAVGAVVRGMPVTPARPLAEQQALLEAGEALQAARRERLTAELELRNTRQDHEQLASSLEVAVARERRATEELDARAQAWVAAKQRADALAFTAGTPEAAVPPGDLVAPGPRTARKRAVLKKPDPRPSATPRAPRPQHVADRPSLTPTAVGWIRPTTAADLPELGELDRRRLLEAARQVVGEQVRRPGVDAEVARRAREDEVLRTDVARILLRHNDRARMDGERAAADHVDEYVFRLRPAASVEAVPNAAPAPARTAEPEPAWADWIPERLPDQLPDWAPDWMRGDEPDPDLPAPAPVPPVQVPPAPRDGAGVHSLGTPRGELPGVDGLADDIAAALTERGLELPAAVRDSLGARLVSAYRELAGDGYLLQLGRAEVLIRLRLDNPRLVGDPAGAYRGNPVDGTGADRGSFKATQNTHGSFNTGGHSQLTSGQAGAFRIQGSVGVVLAGLVRLNVGASGTANQVNRSGAALKDAESGRVMDNRDTSTLVAYDVHWSAQVRTQPAAAWPVPTPARTAGQPLLLWVPDDLLRAGPAQITADEPADTADDRDLALYDSARNRLPETYFAAGLTGLRELSDRVVQALAGGGVTVRADGPQLRNLHEHLSRLNANLGEAVNAPDGYAFLLRNEAGDVEARVEIHTELVQQGAERLGVTSSLMHLERVRTAIAGVSGGESVAQQSGVNGSVAVDVLPAPGVTLGPSVKAGVTWTNTDALNAGRTGLWVLVSRFTGRVTTQRSGLRHTATVWLRSRPQDAPVSTPPVDAAAVLMLPEAEAFRHGFPVDVASAAPDRAPDAAGRLAYSRDAVPEDRVPDPVDGAVTLPAHVREGRGIGTGLVRIDPVGVDDLHTQLAAELAQTGFLPPDPARPFARRPDGAPERPDGVRLSLRVNDRLQNAVVLRRFTSTDALDSHYDQIHQDGMSFTLRGVGPLGLTRFARVTITAEQQVHDDERHYRRQVSHAHSVNLSIAGTSVSQGVTGSKAISVGGRFNAGLSLAQMLGAGVDHQWTEAAGQTGTYIGNRPELLEYNGTLNEFVVGSRYTATVEYDRPDVTLIATPPAWRSEPVEADATLHLVPAFDPGVPPPGPTAAPPPTDPAALDAALIYHVDTHGLLAAARSLQPGFTGPGRAGDDLIANLTSTVMVRSHLREILRDQFRTGHLFRSGFFGDRQGELAISGTLGASTFAGATPDQFTYGAIKLWLSQIAHSHSRRSDWTLSAGLRLGGAIEGEGALGLLSGESGVVARPGRGRSEAMQRTAGKEQLLLDFHRLYAFSAPLELTVGAVRETHGKLRPTRVRVPGEITVGPRTMMYVLPEPQALAAYGRGQVPVPADQVLDAVQRWSDGHLKGLEDDVVVSVLDRLEADGTPAASLADFRAVTNAGGLRARLTQIGRTVEQLVVPPYLTGSGPKALGHSGVESMTFRRTGPAATTPEPLLDVVRDAVESVAPGMLGARRADWRAHWNATEVWYHRFVSDQPVMGRLAIGMDVLTGLLAGDREHQMTEDLLHSDGVSLYLVNRVGWLMADVVELNLALEMTSAPEFIGYSRSTGLENYDHGYVGTSSSTSRHLTYGATLAKLGLGGRNQTSGTTGAAQLDVGAGRHAEVTRSDQITQEQTVYDWTGHYLVRAGHRLTVRARRVDMPGRPGNNLLISRYRDRTGRAGETVVELGGDTVLRLPRALVEGVAVSDASGVDLTPLPALPGDAYVTAALLDDALPAAWELLGRAFGSHANDTGRRPAPTLQQMLSRSHLKNHLHRAVAGQRYEVARDLFVPGHSRTRLTLHLTGDLFHLQVVEELPEGTGTGRYAKHQIGTSVSATDDEWRAAVTGSVGQAGHLVAPPLTAGSATPATAPGSAPPGAPPTTPTTLPPDHTSAPHAPADGSVGTVVNRISPRGEGASDAANHRAEQHIKHQGPVTLVRMTFHGRLEAEVRRHGVTHTGPPRRLVSDRITGEVYVEMFTAELEQYRLEAAQIRPVPGTRSGVRTATTPQYHLEQLLARAEGSATDRLAVTREVARFLTGHARSDHLVLMSSPGGRAHARHLAVRRWARTRLRQAGDADRAAQLEAEPPAMLADPTADQVRALTASTAALIAEVVRRDPAARPPAHLLAAEDDPLSAARLIAHALGRSVDLEDERADGTRIVHRIGPDGAVTGGAPETRFLAGLNVARLSTAQLPALVDLLDLREPRTVEWAHPGHRPTPEPTGIRILGRREVPPLVHLFRLGGPVTAPGPEAAAFRAAAEGLARRLDGGHLRLTLFTAVPRRAFVEADAGTGDPEVAAMLDWARQHGIRLLAVDEVFSAGEPMRDEAGYRRALAAGDLEAAEGIARLEVLQRFGGTAPGAGADDLDGALVVGRGAEPAVVGVRPPV